MLNLNDLINDGKITLEKISDASGTYRRSIWKQEPYMEINLSSQYSFLIKKAAEYCSHYASDLIISINSMETKMGKIDEYEDENRQLVEWFGFRDMGVDYDAFIESRGIDRDEYKAIYVIVFELEDTLTGYADTIYYYNATLYKVNVNH